jgi:hypothetical protein
VLKFTDQCSLGYIGGGDDLRYLDLGRRQDRHDFVNANGRRDKLASVDR